MKSILKIDLDHPDEEALEAMTRCLREGKVLLYPTDTVYGLGCDPFRPQAVQRIERLKGRAPGKSFILLIPDRQSAYDLMDGEPAAFRRFSDTLWPGPVTLVARAGRTVDRSLVGPRETVAMRWAGSRFLETLFLKWPHPLLSTSANRTGEPPLDEPSTSLSPVVPAADLVIDGGPLRQPASAIIDLSVTPPQLIRRGTLSDSLLAALGVATETPGGNTCP